MADSIQFRRGLRSTVKALPIGMPGFIEDEERLVIGKGDGTNTELPNKADMDNINSQMAEKANKTDLDTTNANIGDKSQLNTSNKSNIVNAIKEVKTQANTKADKSYVDSKFGSISTTFTFLGSDTTANIQAKTGENPGDYWYSTDDNTNLAWNGTNWIDIGNNLNVGDKTITPEKTTFMSKKNLFNKDTITVGSYVQQQSGNLSELEGYNASDFIPIKPSTLYTIKTSGTIEQIALYDESKEYVGGIATPNNTFTSFTTAHYVRLSIKDEQLDNFMLVEGNYIGEYIPYGSFIDKNIIPELPYVKKTNQITIHVGKDAPYTFATLGSAFASIENTEDWTEIIIHEGIYEEKDLVLPDKVILRGINKKNVLIRGYQPPETSDSEIARVSTLNVVGDFVIQDLTITGQNMKYAIHDEGNGLNVDATHKIINCYIRHYGNEEAKAYRVANSQSSSGVWNFTHSLGFGSASGLKFIAENTEFISDYESGWHVHTNKDFEKPNINILKNCICCGLYSMLVQSCGSGTSDKVILDNTRLEGRIVYNHYPWIPTEPEKQIADRAEIDIIGQSNPVPFENEIATKCLRITSANNIIVSGDAVKSILGNYKTFQGQGGLNSYILGGWDVNGVLSGLDQTTSVNNTLSKQLGDCSITNKTLIITINSVDYTVIFNKNYTTITTTQILSEINSVLGLNATADIYDMSFDYKPNISNWYCNYLNNTASGIAKGTVVTLNNAYNTIKIMNSTDNFLGVAMEDINPSNYGKIQIKGFIPRYGAKGLTNAITFGDSYGVINGSFVKDASPTVIKGMLADYIGFNLG